MANSSSGESIITRVVRILSVFDADTTSLTLSELAARAGLPVSTTHRLVVEMLDQHLLTRDKDRALQVGTRLWELAARAPRTHLALRNASLPIMEHLHMSLCARQTLLAVLENDTILYLERVLTGSSAVNITQKDGRLPPLTTSSGFVLLAHLAPDYQEHLLALPPEELGLPAGQDRHTTRALLARTRQTGYMSRQGVVYRDTTSIAVPIFDPAAEVLAALAIVVPHGSENYAQNVPLLQEASQNITAELARKTSLSLAARRL